MSEYFLLTRSIYQFSFCWTCALPSCTFPPYFERSVDFVKLVIDWDNHLLHYMRVFEIAINLWSSLTYHPCWILFLCVELGIDPCNWPVSPFYSVVGILSKRILLYSWLGSHVTHLQLTTHFVLVTHATYCVGSRGQSIW